MEKIIKYIDMLVEKTLKFNINSTTSVVAYQPKVPKKLISLSRFKDNDDK